MEASQNVGPPEAVYCECRARMPKRTSTRVEGDSFGSALRARGPASLAATAIILLAGNVLGAAAVFAWAWRSGTPIRDLGFRPEPRWIRTVVWGTLIGVMLKLVLKAVVMPLVGFGGTNQTYRYLVGNTAALPAMLLFVIVGGGFGEETIWRGFLFERLEQYVGGSVRARAAIVTVSAMLFGLAHYVDQGAPGVAQSLLTGLAFGAIYVATDRLWISIVAHAAFDVTAVLMMYWNLEAAVAHSVFG